MSAADVIGMMDGAYFISRSEILDFFNTLLDMSLSKVEQTASGAVACQLVDYMYPGSIPMKRVNWEAKSDFQYIENYKILQAALTKQGVQKNVDVDRLIRGRMQDNLEFCQWLKAFFEQAQTGIREDYDPVHRRNLGKGGKNLDDIFLPNKKKNGIGGVGSRSAAGGGAGRRKISTTSSRASPSSVGATSRFKKNSPSPSKAKATRDRLRNQQASSPTKTTRNKLPSSLDQSSEDSAVVIDAQLKEENTKLKEKVAEMELTMNGFEQERDFYFEKLRGIEVLLQVHEEKGVESDSNDVIQNIFRVLYARHEDGIQVTDDGEILENSFMSGGSESAENLLNDTIDGSFDDLS